MLKFNSKTILSKTFLLKPHLLNYNKICDLSLVEIGKFETPKTNRYQAGQLFIHKLFGYRGMVVLPWTGHIFDRDIQEKLDDTSFEMVFVGGREVKFYIKNYYQIFIDSRDRPYVRTLNEVSTAVAGTPTNCNRLLHYAPGLDYVAHEDILPYTATEKVPIQHEMFNEFFNFKSGNGIEPKEILLTNLKKKSALMKIDVHKETTENIKVIAIPNYLGCQRMENVTMYSWRYSIRIENFTNSPIRLISQKWKIYSLTGIMEEVCGHGVMGEEVIMDRSLPAFQYSSHINLLTPYGHMVGTFKMERQDFTKFFCRVPHILLESRRGFEEMPC